VRTSNRVGSSRRTRSPPAPTLEGAGILSDRDTLYFDGACGLCRRSVRVYRALDWLGRLRFEDMRLDERAAKGIGAAAGHGLPALPVTIEQAWQGIPMRTRDGRGLYGFPAMRRALIQTPLGALVAWLLYIPGLSHVGGAAYRSIAARRARAAACVPRSDG
jgi:predicted DCC family thiol-disulfide oxidoreductase YuxK